MTYDDEDRQHVLGVPVRVRRGRSRPRPSSEQRTVLGLPLSWFAPRPQLDTRWLRHPGRWLRWRAQVRRLGPYAPDYEGADVPHGTGT